jgi:hypothetical protein
MMHRMAGGLLAAWVMAAGPMGASAQVEVMAGAMVADSDSPARAAPFVSLTLGLPVVPLLFEAGVGRADFNSFGEDFHRHYGMFFLGGEWTVVRSGVDVALRLGLGALVEDDINEDDPAFRSSNNWVEAVVPALVIRKPLASGRAMVFTVSDHVLGPFNAVLDPDEYGMEHRLRILLGIRF